MSIPVELTDGITHAQNLLKEHQANHKTFLAKILDHLQSLNTQTTKNKDLAQRVTQMIDTIGSIKAKTKFLMGTLQKAYNWIKLFQKSTSSNLDKEYKDAKTIASNLNSLHCLISQKIQDIYTGYVSFMADGEMSFGKKGVVTLNNIKNWNSILKIKKDNDLSDLLTRLEVYKRYILFGIVHLYIYGFYSPKNGFPGSENLSDCS
jgi:hypothetical protein